MRRIVVHRPAAAVRAERIPVRKGTHHHRLGALAPRIAGETEAPRPPSTVVPDGTTADRPSTVVPDGTTADRPSTVVPDGTTADRPSTVAQDGTTAARPSTVAQDGTRIRPLSIEAQDGTTAARPSIVAQDGTTAARPSTVVPDGTRIRPLSIEAQDGTTADRPSTVAQDGTIIRPPSIAAIGGRSRTDAGRIRFRAIEAAAMGPWTVIVSVEATQTEVPLAGPPPYTPQSDPLRGSPFEIRGPIEIERWTSLRDPTKGDVPSAASTFVLLTEYPPAISRSISAVTTPIIHTTVLRTVR